MTPTDLNNDNDLRKGAIEEDNPHDKPMTSLRGQLGHRDQDPLLKSSDTDFPEPGENPEHMGQFKERNHKDQDTRLVGSSDPERRNAAKPAGDQKTTDAPGQNAEGATQDQDPGHRQKQNQNKKKDDDLAA